MLTLIVDGLLAVLLLAALALGLRLQRSLHRLRHDDGEIGRLIEGLDTATSRSASALDGLRQTADATAERLAEQLAGAQRLLDDLRFLSSRGEQLADRLEQQISRGRRAAPPTPLASMPAPPAQAGRAAELERTLKALR